ncbi:hypothetical protein A2774_05975 [Candidatus Roizmanbacteria bacterium RIFCSPHIGHO2_01_FULL_39_12c]|uniref:Uncharacterized protein n=1 Tax=Candidatus Roizmanbacteria bacterium RIFCSPHIGHO2_01_FULL_39_12c TaxID=1802031 RepID=A0A1F7G9H5_9BACT|nr:MAG: hypothetical protein A2774_05975 [Candidatus Roizmanbacteria bacterium RIFCSPHIGHO2_01_FULL_39_12c]OGK47234.1 MAG: hypothetical protein A2963_04175 [Candidatus Roizmanbacteria bacterium RIFCSPLOWO2_01_FULL_40_13]
MSNNKETIFDTGQLIITYYEDGGISLTAKPNHPLYDVLRGFAFYRLGGEDEFDREYATAFNQFGVRLRFLPPTHPDRATLIAEQYTKDKKGKVKFKELARQEFS